MTLTKAICVWLDSDSDHDNPTWIVSLDSLDSKGRAVTTHTLDTCADETDAIASAKKEARQRELPLYRNPASGPAELIEDVGSDTMLGDALGLDADECYCGNCDMDYRDLSIAGLRSVLGRRPCPACEQALSDCMADE